MVYLILVLLTDYHHGENISTLLLIGAHWNDFNPSGGVGGMYENDPEDEEICWDHISSPYDFRLS